MDEPAVLADRLYAVRVLPRWDLRADIKIDAAVSIVCELLHPAVEAYIADLRPAIVVGATSVLAVKRQRPKLFDRHAGGHVQLVGRISAQHVPFAVALRGHVNLTRARLRIDHAFGAGHRLIEPRRPLIDLGDAGGFLLDLEIEALVPGRAGPV